MCVGGGAGEGGSHTWSTETQVTITVLARQLETTTLRETSDIGHNVKMHMPDLNSKPCINFLYSLKSLFSALTRHTDAGLSFFVTFILFNYAHACLSSVIS